MTVKTARTYTLDELKVKCQKALDDPNLVEIVRTAPLNNDGKVNCSWAYKEAKKYVLEQTKDLQETKELAVAARFLAMLRRDHTEEFEKLVAHEKQSKPTTGQKNFFKREFKLPEYTTTIARTIRTTRGDFSEISIQFCREVYPGTEYAVNFCLDILGAILEDNDLSWKRRELRDRLIHFLEEKFGLKLRICVNCKHFDYKFEEEPSKGYFCDNREPNSQRPESFHTYPLSTWPEQTCSAWAPKEVSEKLSSA